MGRYENDISEQIEDVPPKLVDELTAVAKEFMERNYSRLSKLSPRIPREPINVAKWWATIERPPRRGFEDCKKLTGKISKKEYWNCPYIDYCKYTLINFLQQSAEFQELIIDANLKKCYWRGDDEENFLKIFDEFNLMQEDKTPYINETVKRLKMLYGK